MKKQIRPVIALFVLLGVVGMIGMTTPSFAQDDGVPKCNCQIVNGGEDVYGRIIGDDCIPNPCWLEID